MKLCQALFPKTRVGNQKSNTGRRVRKKKHRRVEAKSLAIKNNGAMKKSKRKSKCLP